MNILPQNAIQISKLLAEGHSVDTVYQMLDGDYDREIIEAINMARGKMKADGMLSSVVNDTDEPIITNTPQEANQVYKQAQAQVARRLVRFALTETENPTAAVRALIYCNEEATERNADRVKNHGNGGVLMLLAPMLDQIKRAKNAASLQLQEGKPILDV